MFLNWTYNKIAFVIAKEIKTYWSYIVRICINLASNILLLESKKYFLTSQGLVGADMNRIALNYNSLDAKQNVKKKKKKMETCIYLNTSNINHFIINIPNLPNSSTPKAANMKKRRKNRRPRLPTCGKACITVSNNARIPLAIFSNFSTVKTNYSDIIIIHCTIFSGTCL
jgi:hypothetical protein